MHFSIKTVLLVTLVGSMVLPGAAAAPANETTKESAQNATIRISSNVEMLDSGFDDETGEAYVVLQAEQPEAVTLSDGGGLSAGSGEIASTTSPIGTDPTRVEVPVTRHNGRVGVIISTDQVLYGHLIKTGDPLIRGPFTARDAQITALAAALSTAAVSLVMVFRHIRGTDAEPERIA